MYLSITIKGSKIEWDMNLWPLLLLCDLKLPTSTNSINSEWSSHSLLNVLDQCYQVDSAVGRAIVNERFKSLFK